MADKQMAACVCVCVCVHKKKPQQRVGELDAR